MRIPSIVDSVKHVQFSQTRHWNLVISVTDEWVCSWRSLSNSNPVGTSLKTTEHHSMLDFALRSFNGLKHTAHKSRCSQLVAQLHAWGGRRGHAILINNAASPHLFLKQALPVSDRRIGTEAGNVLTTPSPRRMLTKEERHKWTIIHDCLLETFRKPPRCLEGKS